MEQMVAAMSAKKPPPRSSKVDDCKARQTQLEEEAGQYSADIEWLDQEQQNIKVAQELLQKEQTRLSASAKKNKQERDSKEQKRATAVNELQRVTAQLSDLTERQKTAYLAQQQRLHELASKMKKVADETYK
jgi:DNA repair exonuclease SbcCD ATPase subunit